MTEINDAAVEAAVTAIRATREFAVGSVTGIPSDAMDQVAEAAARAAIAAALPHLTPESASVEEVAGVVRGHGLDDYSNICACGGWEMWEVDLPERLAAHSQHQANALLTRFNITPKETN